MPFGQSSVRVFILL